MNRVSIVWLIAMAWLGIPFALATDTSTTAGRISAVNTLSELLDDTTTADRGKILGLRAEAHIALGNFPRALQDLELARQAYRQEGDWHNELAVCLRLGEMFVNHSLTPDKGLPPLMRASTLADQFDDKEAAQQIEDRLAGWASRSHAAAQLAPTMRSSMDWFLFRGDLSATGGTITKEGEGSFVLLRRRLSRFDGTFLQRLPLPDDPLVKGYARLGKGKVYAGTPDGLYLNDGAWHRVEAVQTNGIIAADGSGGLWIGDEGFVHHYRPEVGVDDTLELQALPSGQPNSVKSFTVTAEGRWTVTTGGVFWTSNTGNRQTLPSLSDPRHAIIDGDSIWVISTDGATRFVDGVEKERFSPQELTGNPSVRALLRTRDGTLWMGLGRGIARKTRDATGVFQERSDRYEQVYGLAEAADGALWFLNQQGSLGRIGHNRITTYDRLVLPSGWIFSAILRHDGRLLLATGAGAAIFDPKTLETLHFNDDEHCAGVLWDAVDTEAGWATASRDEGCLAWVPSAGDTQTYITKDGLPLGKSRGLAFFAERLCMAMNTGVFCREGDAFVVLPELRQFEGQEIIRIAADGDRLLIALEKELFALEPQGEPYLIPTPGLGSPLDLIETGGEIRGRRATEADSKHRFPV
ncbi:MAG: hypothetical protein HN348_22960, partial [Proteobacteria bacterium]|nr:hypothetical protein [Pseudomonadota bacterium]